MRNFLLLLFVIVIMNTISCMEYKRQNTPYTKEEYKNFLVIKALSDLFFDYKTTSHLFECNQTLTLNPLRGRTESGYFLEFSYDLPFALWTPLGKVCFRSFWQVKNAQLSLINEECISKFLNDLGAEEYRSEKTTKDFYKIGPIYRITKVQDILLSEPLELHKEAKDLKEQAREHARMKIKWKKMKKKYEKSKKRDL